MNYLGNTLYVFSMAAYGFAIFSPYPVWLRALAALLAVHTFLAVEE